MEKLPYRLSVHVCTTAGAGVWLTGLLCTAVLKREVCVPSSSVHEYARIVCVYMLASAPGLPSLGTRLSIVLV